MTKASPRIALIHATPVAIDPVVAAFEALWPAADVYNLLEDSLAPDLERTGCIDSAMDDRFLRLGRYALDCGADAILFTCSAFGRCIEGAAADLAPIPVLKPNEAMFAEALATGTRVGMVATFQPSLPSMEAEFIAMAKAAGSKASLQSVCAPAAMAALLAGDDKTHNRLVTEAAATLDNPDVILLAQFSTAKAADDVHTRTGKPVLTSPASAVHALQARLAVG